MAGNQHGQPLGVGPRAMVDAALGGWPATGDRSATGVIPATESGHPRLPRSLGGRGDPPAYTNAVVQVVPIPTVIADHSRLRFNLESALLQELRAAFEGAGTGI